MLMRRAFIRSNPSHFSRVHLGLGSFTNRILGALATSRRPVPDGFTPPPVTPFAWSPHVGSPAEYNRRYWNQPLQPVRKPMDRSSLKRLPVGRYRQVQRRSVRVNTDYHVQADDRLESVAPCLDPPRGLCKARRRDGRDLSPAPARRRTANGQHPGRKSRKFNWDCTICYSCCGATPDVGGWRYREKQLGWRES